MVYCQWKCTLLQTLNMTQPPGSHHPLHGLHLTANKVPHTRSCVGIGHSPRECSPLYHGEVPTHAGVNHDSTTRIPSSTSRVAPHGKQGVSYEELCGYWSFSKIVFTPVPRRGSYTHRGKYYEALRYGYEKLVHKVCCLYYLSFIHIYIYYISTFKIKQYTISF